MVSVSVWLRMLIHKPVGVKTLSVLVGVDFLTEQLKCVEGASRFFEK